MVTVGRAQIRGWNKLRRKLDQLPGKVRRKAVVKALKPTGNAIKRKAKALAPKGPTGNLKRSMQLKTLPGFPPAVSVRPRYFGPAGTRAPHQHLVERGTGPRTRTRLGGKFATITDPTAAQLRTGSMPAQPFMEPAWNQSAATAEKDITSRMWDEVKKAAK